MAKSSQTNRVYRSGREKMKFSTEQALEQWTRCAPNHLSPFGGKSRVCDWIKDPSVGHALGYLFASAMACLILASISSVM